METISLKPIQVNDEHVYQPPPAPADRTKILFHQYKPADQYWRNDPDELKKALGLNQYYFDWNELTEVNQEHTSYDEHTGMLKTLSIDDTRELVEMRDRELYRRQHGIHFFNNGEIEYITGDNYNFLAYYVIPDTGRLRPGFRKFQRDVFYIIDIADKDPNILGAFIAKAKKTGLSHIMASLMLNRSMMVRNRAFGMMNKGQDEANLVNLVFFSTAYLEYPPIMRPKISRQSDEKIIFGQPNVRYTGTKQSIEKVAQAAQNKPLNNWIYTAPTQIKLKFDGPLMYYIHADEFPKWKNPRAIFGKLTETVKLQQTINGKIWITSYPPEEDNQGFEEGKEIYYNSKLSTIDKNSVLPRTASGLICHFVSALVSTDGTFDKYGNADMDRALALNEAERKSCKTSQDLQEKIRQYCRTEDECWRAGGKGSTFNNIRLAAGIDHMALRARAGEVLYVEGDLEWIGKRFGDVKFVPRTKEEIKADPKLGWWRQFEHYKPHFYNNVKQDAEGNYRPSADSKFIAASDPTEYKMASTVDKAPSNSAIVAISFPDVERDTLMRLAKSKYLHSDVEVLEYVGRREDPDDYLEDLIKTIFYLGCYVIVEANKAWVITALTKLHLQHFILVRLADRSIVPFEESGEEYPSGVSSSPDVIEAYCREGNRYLREPHPGSELPDMLMQGKSERLYSELMKFDPNNTKKFDLGVCWLLCQLAKAAFSVFRDRLKEKEKQYENIVAIAEAFCNPY